MYVHAEYMICWYKYIVVSFIQIQSATAMRCFFWEVWEVQFERKSSIWPEAEDNFPIFFRWGRTYCTLSPIIILGNL